MTSGVSLNSSGKTVEFLQESSGKGILECSTEGVSLRNWVKHGFIEANKAERLQMYRQVVQLVDMAHSQGTGLHDLCLSNFVLLPSNKIMHFDSSKKHKLATVFNQNINGKRMIEHESGVNCWSGTKQQKPGDKLRFSTHHASNSEILGSDAYYVTVELEKSWYACPEDLHERGLLSANIYSLGILLFELLCSFVSLDMHSAAISDLHNRILPPTFISENPKEAGFCLWLLHPQPSSRPTTREILQSELLSGTQDLYSKNTYSSTTDKNKDPEFDILIDFLISLEKQKEKHAFELHQNLRLLETDIKSFEHKHVLKMLHDSNIPDPKLKTNIGHLETAYFNKRPKTQLAYGHFNERNDPDLLGDCENVACLDDFLNDICKFIRYGKFEVCGSLKIGNLLNSTNVICSLSFNRDEDYIAAAGVSKKIKIFEFASILGDSVDVNYPVVELPNRSKLSCICWNKYLKNRLASADYDGVIQIWDANTGQVLSGYIEHQLRAWCVDFSHVDTTQFASGSDDCSVKLWSLNEKNSTCTIRNSANVCCVQFSSCSSQFLAFGSADYKIHCYDLRHTKIPWCTLDDHQKAVSYVKFLDTGSLVSASTDNTLKLWDLKKTNLEGVSPEACCMTYRGHTNERNFVGLSILDGYIACGSESNQVYVYHKSFPMPVSSYKFGSDDDETGAQFVSSVCWSEKSNMIVAANSGGNIKILKMS